MELLQLKYFQAVAQYEHIGRAAKQLNVSQPAVSLMISRLEEELGVKLFNRVGRNIILNEYGMAFLQRVNAIIQEEASAINELNEMQAEADETISIAMTSPNLLDGVLLPYIEANPDIKWKIRVADIQQCINLMKTGEVDFCVSSPGIWGNGFKTTLCIEDDLVVVASCNHHFAGEKFVTLQEIASERIISLVGEHAFRQLIDEIFNSYGIRLNYHIECDHFLRNKLMEINQGIYIGMKTIKGRNLYGNNVCFIPISAENFPKTQITISHAYNRFLGKNAQLLIEHIVQFYRKLASEE